jgi:prefoldin subunit 5
VETLRDFLALLALILAPIGALITIFLNAYRLRELKKKIEELEKDSKLLREPTPEEVERYGRRYSAQPESFNVWLPLLLAIGITSFLTASLARTDTSGAISSVQSDVDRLVAEREAQQREIADLNAELIRMQRGIREITASIPVDPRELIDRLHELETKLEKMQSELDKLKPKPIPDADEGK